MAAETIRDVVIRISIQQAFQSLKMPVLEQTAEKVQQVDKAAKESVKKITGDYSKLDKELVLLRHNEEKATKKMEEMGQKAREAGLRAGDHFKAAGEGAFIFARGIALLGASSDEDLTKLIRRIAEIQGLFDVFKGGFEIFKNLSEGMRFLTIRANAVAVANGKVATSNAAVAASNATVIASNTATAASYAAVAKAAIAAQAASLGVAGRVVAAIATVMASAFVARKVVEGWEEEAENDFRQKKAESIDRFNRQVRAARDEFERAMNDMQASEERAFGINSEARGQITGHDPRIVVAEKLLSVDQERARINQDLNRDMPTGEIFSGLSTSVENIEDLRAVAGRLLEGDAILADLDKIESVFERINQAEKENIALQREKITLLGESIAAQSKYVMEVRKETSELKEALKTEQERVKSAMARFGRMDVFDQMEAERIANKISGGEQLTEEDARAADRLQMFQKQADDFFAQKAEQEGGRFALFQSGELHKDGRPREVTETEIKKRLDQQQQFQDSPLFQMAEQQLKEDHQRLEKERKALIDSLRENNTVTVRVISDIRNEIERIKRDMEYAQQARQAAEE